MAKIGPKEAARRALRERGAVKPAKTTAPSRLGRSGVRKGPKKAKARPRPTVEVSTPVTDAIRAGLLGITPKIGRPSTGFDRTKYQAVYTTLRRKHGRQYTPKGRLRWPPEAVEALNSVRSPRKI